MNIELSVALPVWKSNSIAWLAMESLCRQDVPPCDWELLVCEEPHDEVCGTSFFESYASRLFEKGCRRLLYLSLETWAPLSEKWHLMGAAVSAASRAFLLQAADDYSFRERLCKTHRRVVEEEHDWYDVARAPFCDVASMALATYDRGGDVSRTHLGIAFASKHARTIPRVVLRKNVDGMLFDHCRREAGESFRRFTDFSDYAWVFTSGYNTISLKRAEKIEKGLAPYKPGPASLEAIGLPTDIIERLRTRESST